MSWINDKHTSMAMIEYEERKRMEKYSAENLVGHHFLCRIEPDNRLFECEVMRISPSGVYIEIRLNGTLKTQSTFQWFTRYDFDHKLAILEILDGDIDEVEE